MDHAGVLDQPTRLTGDELDAAWHREASPLGWFGRRTGTVAVVDAAGGAIVSVDVTSELRP